MALLDRDAEIAAIAAAVGDVREGYGRVVVITGDAGLGKSALLGELADRAASAGVLVLHGRAAEHERDVPFGLVVDLLDDHVSTLHPRRIEELGPELASVLPSVASGSGGADPGAAESAGPSQRFRYHRALRTLVETLGRERPVARVLDDMHWADAASLEWVLHLLRRWPRAPLLLALGTRPVDPAPALLDAARSAPELVRLALGAIGHEASLRLVADLPDAHARERVVADAGGNPLFISELARAARGDSGSLPPTLIAAVQLESAALPPAARALLDGAAVAGDPFDPELAAAAADIDPGDALGPLDRIAAAGLVRPDGDGRGFVFRHALVRRSVYDAAPAAWRLGAHERVAELLERRGARTAAIAHHVERAGRVGDLRAVTLLEAAASESAATAPAAAAHWYRSALELLPAGADGGRVRLLRPMALALAAAGRLAESRAALIEASDLLANEPLSERLDLAGECMRTEALLGRYAEAQRRLDAAVAEAGEPRHVAELALAGALIAYYRGDDRESVRWSERALAEASGDDVTLIAAAEAGIAHGEFRSGDRARGLEFLASAKARVDAMDDATLARRPAVAQYVSGAQMASHKDQEAIRTCTRGLAVAEAYGHGQLQVLLAMTRGIALAGQLDLDGADRDLEALEDMLRLHGPEHLLLTALSARAIVHDWRGEATQARRAADQCLDLVGRMEPGYPAALGQCEAVAVFVDEDPARVMNDMQAAAGPGLEQIDHVRRSTLLVVLVQAMIGASRLAEAEDTVEILEHVAAASDLPLARVRVLRARAELLMARGDHEAAARAATEALRLAEEVGGRTDLVEVRLVAGRALGAAGEREAAVEELQKVAADAARGGALKWRDSAARELRKLGARISAESRRAAGSAAGAGDLTDREREIADLVASGSSNKQVAAALFVSEKTVESHLSRVYDKLGVRSRVELAREYEPRVRAA